MLTYNSITLTIFLGVGFKSLLLNYASIFSISGVSSWIIFIIRGSFTSIWSIIFSRTIIIGQSYHVRDSFCFLYCFADSHSPCRVLYQKYWSKLHSTCFLSPTTLSRVLFIRLSWRWKMKCAFGFKDLVIWTGSTLVRCYISMKGNNILIFLLYLVQFIWWEYKDFGESEFFTLF